MNDISFESPVKAYSKIELAHLYNPEKTYQSALYTLRSWIARNKDLQAALRQTGYSSKQQSFTPRQVQLIYHYLGEP